MLIIAKKLICVMVLILIVTMLASCKKEPQTEEEITEELSKDYGNVEVMPIIGNSMEPDFKDGQTAYVATEYYEKNAPEKGDVVAVSFKTKENPFIKRVAFVSGDKFIQSGNTFTLEGSDTSIELSPDSVLYKQLVRYNFVVPENAMIILGGNEDGSLDSKTLGLIEVSMLSGKIVK